MKNNSPVGSSVQDGAWALVQESLQELRSRIEDDLAGRCRQDLASKEKNQGGPAGSREDRIRHTACAGGGQSEGDPDAALRQPAPLFKKPDERVVEVEYARLEG